MEVGDIKNLKLAARAENTIVSNVLSKFIRFLHGSGYILGEIDGRSIRRIDKKNELNTLLNRFTIRYHSSRVNFYLVRKEKTPHKLPYHVVIARTPEEVPFTPPACGKCPTVIDGVVKDVLTLEEIRLRVQYKSTFGWCRSCIIEMGNIVRGEGDERDY